MAKTLRQHQREAAKARREQMSDADFLAHQSAAGKGRWADKSPEERSAYGRMMAEARERTKREREAAEKRANKPGKKRASRGA